MRILDFTTDCLLRATDKPGYHVVHCQSGPALMHSGCPKLPPQYRYLRIFFELLRGRCYDWIICPPIHIDWTVSNDPLRKLFKRLCAFSMQHPVAFRWMIRLFFGRDAKFAVTDYSDKFAPSEFALRCLQPVHYFMLNVSRELVGQRVGPGLTLIHYLPTVIQDDLIDSLASRQAELKQYDVFIAGYYHNNQREKQREAAELLAARGVEVFELKEKSFEKFTEGMLRSKLCFAAKGLAYHCFRPLEAAAAGAAPVYHLPEKGTYHDYVDGQNCFLYDPSLTAEQIADLVQIILADKQRISLVACGARKLLEEKHRASVLSWHLLETLSGSIQ